MATSAVSYCNHLSSRVTIPAARGSKLIPHSFENRKKLHAPALPGSVAPGSVDCHSCRNEDGAAASIVGHRNSTILISQGKKQLGRATSQGIRRQNIWCNSHRELAELAQEKMMMKLDGSPTDERLSSFKFCRCPSCGRRGLVAGLIGGFASSMDKKAFGASDFRVDEYNKIIEAVHPGRGAWYEEFFARVMESGMDSYETMVRICFYLLCIILQASRQIELRGVIHTVIL
ncbi:hypothetical protein R1sor_002942 [Riccia sorocarpa]|uniref:Uncharacterized protein n=1 Tax=Riccia sorocarpa TaxID=122646 RepID=A0ABD3H3G2_9MARC